MQPECVCVWERGSVLDQRMVNELVEWGGGGGSDAQLSPQNKLVSTRRVIWRVSSVEVSCLQVS